MYAVVEIAGKQFTVKKGDRIKSPQLDGEVNNEVEFDRVLLTSDGENVTVGDPLIKGARVKASILDFNRHEKVFVFKKKRRKGYRVLNGHRQGYTHLEILDIILS